jgi:hypothetical protein
LLIYIKQAARIRYAGADRCIGTFESREKAAFAYKIVWEKLKMDSVQRPLDLDAAEAAVRQAQVAAFEAVGVQCPVVAREKLKVQDPVARQKSKAAIDALSAASGGKNDRAAVLAAEHMQGKTKSPADNKWVSCNTEGSTLLFDCCSSISKR